AWSGREQRDRETNQLRAFWFAVCGGVRGGPPGRTPETDEVHGIVPEGETLRACPTPVRARACAPARAAIQPDPRRDRKSSDSHQCEPRAGARPSTSSV